MIIVEEKIKIHHNSPKKGLNDRYYSPYSASYDKKYSIRLDDGNIIQTGLYVVNRNGIDERSICVSSQVGCKYGCKFCTSGKNGFLRNLTCEEIIKQLELVLADQNIKSFDSIVFMGIGEPLDNFDNLCLALKRITLNKLCISGNIALATIGTEEGFTRLGEVEQDIEIWISLHAVSNDKRSYIMPANIKYNIESLVKLALDYVAKTGKKIWFNYMLFSGFNNTDDDMESLAKILKLGNGNFALIISQPTNDIEKYARCNVMEMELFENKMQKLCPEIEISKFFPAGEEVGAGCGQFSFTPQNI